MQPFAAYIAMFLVIYIFNESAKRLLKDIDKPKNLPPAKEEKPKNELLHNPDGTMNVIPYNRYKAQVMQAIPARREKIKQLQPVSEIETIEFLELEIVETDENKIHSKRPLHQ